MHRGLLACTVLCEIGCQSGNTSPASEPDVATADAAVDCSFVACAGDPVGNWTIARTCGVELSGNSSCLGYRYHYIDRWNSTGTIDIGGDHSYAITAVNSGRERVVVPFGCAHDGCDPMLNWLFPPAAGYHGATCTPNYSAAVCECEAQFTEDWMESGTWESSGSTLTMTGANGVEKEALFCASPTSMKLSDMNIDYGDYPDVSWSGVWMLTR